MSSAQDRLVIAATLLAESAWLYALSRVAGTAFSVHDSHLGWVAVLAVLVVSFLVARTLTLIHMPNSWAYTVQLLAGVTTLYLIMGTQLESPDHWLDLGWIGKLASGTQIEGYTRGATVGSLIVVMLWWRGGRVSSAEYPVDDLETSFKLGIMAMAMAAVVDIFGSEDLNVLPVMFLFFAAALAGLSIGRVLPASRQAITEKMWPKVIGGVTASVVVVGLLFSLLQKGVLPALSGPAGAVFDGLKTVIIYAFILPVAYVLGYLVRFIIYLLPTSDEEGFAEEIQGGSARVELGLVETADEAGRSLFIEVMGWVLLAIILVIALFLLSKAFRRWVRVRLVQSEGIRESVMEDANPGYDMAQLLYNLIPERFRRGKPPSGFNLPEDEADVVEVFRVYFRLLTLAEGRGHPRPPHQTPAEYQRTLEQIFPRDLVRRATAAFVRACYGHHPAPRQQIEEMRASLEQLAAGGA